MYGLYVGWAILVNVLELPEIISTFFDHVYVDAPLWTVSVAAVYRVGREGTQGSGDSSLLVLDKDRVVACLVSDWPAMIPLREGFGRATVDDLMQCCNTTGIGCQSTHSDVLSPLRSDRNAT